MRVKADWLPAVIRMLAVVLIVLAPLLAAIPGDTVAQTSRPRYDITVDLNIDTARANVAQTVEYTNNTGDNLSELVFHITAAYYKAFTLTATQVNGQAVTPTLDGIVLEVPLPATLEPGQSTRVTFEFELVVPQPGNLRFGADQGVIALGNWYPVLAVYRRGALTYNRLPTGWDRHQQGTPEQTARGLQPGDAFFTDTADYAVNLNLNRAARVAHTGNRVSATATSLRLSASGVRDFAIAASDRYETGVTQVGNTTVTVYYLPEHRAGGQQYSRSASQSLAWFNQNIGPYPYSNLHVAETASNDSAWVGQEYPNVVFISSQITAGPVGVESYLNYLVAHEVLHQWFYGVVGDDQLYEPWVDEAITTHLSYRFLESQDAELGQTTWDTLAERRANDARVYADRPVNTSIYDYDDENHYFAIVYRKGASFFEEVRQLVGDGAYLSAVRNFYSRYAGGIATGRDLLSTLEGSVGAEIRPVVAKYFSYPEYQAQPTAQPTATTAPAASPTATAAPEETPEPSATAQATAQPPEATATATPGASPTATNPPAESPTPSATAAAGPSPAASPVQSPTPDASATPEPSPTVEATPTAAPEPSATPEATPAAEPSATAVATATARTGLPEGTGLAVAAVVLTATGLIGLAVLRGRLR